MCDEECGVDEKRKQGLREVEYEHPCTEMLSHDLCLRHRRRRRGRRVAHALNAMWHLLQSPECIRSGVHVDGSSALAFSRNSDVAGTGQDAVGVACTH